MQTINIFQISTTKSFSFSNDTAIICSHFETLQLAFSSNSVDVPDLMVLEVNSYEEYKNAIVFLNAKCVSIPIIVISKELSKTEAIKIIHLGATDLIDLNDENAYNLLLNSVIDTSNFLIENKEIDSETIESKSHYRTIFLISIIVIGTIVIAVKFIN